MTEFTPDIVISINSQLFPHVDAFLDGVQQMRCVEARVTFESFDAPAFGELIVMADDGGNTYTRTPRLGEFQIHDAWCHFVCGKVFIQLTDKGKEILTGLKAARG